MKKLKFEPSDFNGLYSSIIDCPIARASKRELGYTKPSIGSRSVGQSGHDVEYFIYSCYLNEEKIGEKFFLSNHYDQISAAIQNNTFQNAYIILDSDVQEF